MKTGTGARKTLSYRTTLDISDSNSTTYFVALKDTFQDWTGTTWVRVERDMEADLKAVWPTQTLALVTGIGGNNFNATMWFDDLVFSNSLTVEHNVLQPGSLGQIARRRVINTSAWTVSDAWLHYNHVGSVVATSDSTGASSGLVHQDAFGNPLASITTGAWAASPSGWHHNTKEIDATTGLTYMWQRWYDSSISSFLSTAPYHAFFEHQFSFAAHDPLNAYDPSGEILNIGGSPCYQAQIRAMLERLKLLDPIGYGAWITALERSANTHTILPATISGIKGMMSVPHSAALASTPGTGSDTTIYFNPGLRYTNSPATVNLAHELYHSFDSDRGLRAATPDARERRAMTGENRARLPLGLLPTDPAALNLNLGTPLPTRMPPCP